MSFFDSEIVQGEMKEINRLQQAVYSKVFAFAQMGKSEKLKHVEILESLCEKQGVMYTRLSLSDDPEAKEMKKNIIAGASQMGLPANVDMNILFSQMGQMVEMMRNQLDPD